MRFQDRFSEITKTDLPLKDHSSLKIGGPCDLAAFPRNEKELSNVLTYAKEQNLRTLVAGNGTNLLFSDAGFRGLVVFTTMMKHIHWQENTVTAQAGASLTSLALEAAKRGLSGLAFAYGIPGTVGGAVYMNAGAYGGEISDVLTESTYFDGNAICSRPAEDHAFSYRRSIYQASGEIILSATLTLQKGDSAEILQKSESNMKSRKEKQPLEFPNAGSTFKRPEGHFAGALIEQCGLKGYRIGGAEVSEKHAGFLINRGGATAEDMHRLIDHIQNTVMTRFGVSLETEVISVPTE